MSDRDWFLPCIGLTACSAGAALYFIPHYEGLLPALRILPAWMAAAALIAVISGFIAMLRQGVNHPLAAMRTFVHRERRRMIFVATFMLVAGINLIAFMWMKPLLNYLVPFWADPLLADIDRALFLGNDPWTLLSWLTLPAAGLVYHPGWFIMMIVALLMTASARPSPERSAILLTYFVLWSVAAPAIHMLLPAAGPIFYERLGYGPRFAALDGGMETKAVGDYLWAIYATGRFGAGSGISAMPSMHVTISTWTVVAFNFCLPRWRGVAIAGWIAIFFLSIALGWHYAADGIVGAIAALGCYRGLLALTQAKSRSIARFAPQSLARSAAE